MMSRRRQETIQKVFFNIIQINNLNQFFDKFPNVCLFCLKFNYRVNQEEKITVEIVHIRMENKWF